MNLESLDLMNHKRIIAGITLGVIILIALSVFIIKKAKKKSYQSPVGFKERWTNVTKLCADRKTWPQAVIDADDLLDEALTTSKFKGKTTGEKLVAAQRELTDNEAVWFAHKYRAKIETMDGRKVTKKDVMEALTGFRQALRDLGVLKK